MAQFIDPFRSAGKRQWLDRDTVVSLKGLAILAHNPDLYKHTVALPKVSRGVRLTSPSGSLSIQRVVVRALAHSIGSQLVMLDKRTLTGVRRLAQAKGVSRSLLTKTHLMAALLDLAEETEDERPLIIVVGDKEPLPTINQGTEGTTPTVPYALSSPACVSTLTDELRRRSSRIFFVFTSVGELSSAPTSQPASTPDRNTAGSPSMPPFPGGRPPFFPGMPMPGRAFHVIVRNGTATMVPMNPGDGQGGNQSPFAPPPEILQRIMQEQQRMMQQQQQQQGNPRDTSSNPSTESNDDQSTGSSFLPPDMSEEDLQEIMRDPENQAMIKVKISFIYIVILMKNIYY